MAAEKKFITLARIAEDIHSGWKLEDWLQWPPDFFALISIVFQRTGCYRICLVETELWEQIDWEFKVESSANAWLNYSNQLILGDKEAVLPFVEQKDQKPNLLSRHFQSFKKQWDKLDVNYLRRICDLDGEAPELKKAVIDFAKNLIALLAIADNCCWGLGIVGQMIVPEKKEFRLFHATANILLNNTGSLSTIPKYHGIVLPKMRTPQSGLVLRSLSHHLTFHVTEVEVMWRTFPWLNNHKQSLNILAVPLPDKIDETDFEIIEETYHAVRYFKGKIKKPKKELIQQMVGVVRHYIRQKNEIDIMVFPEMSLTIEMYNLLLGTLETMYKNEQGDKTFQLPMIVAGILKQGDSRSKHFHNEARIATFFAGKWYEIAQRKHHRWNLDRNQILQYKLEGYFNTDRVWFEQSSISQRRLSILIPNGWLALTSLICEDLARQEPVVEVIRGIGPTLLMALLSDGPQLAHRWSARYASILADDPGTAVLSLTSKGMVERSQRSDVTSSQITGAEIKPGKITVALWKDMIRGFKELQLEGEASALMFTISAKFHEEYTLDGRSDGVNASVFRMDTINPVQVRFDNDNIAPYKEELSNKEKTGSWNDIRELSAALFCIDAIIDLMSLYIKNPGKDKIEISEDSIDKSIDIIFSLLQPNKQHTEQYLFLEEIKNLISSSWLAPQVVGIETNNLQTSEPEIKEIIDFISQAQTLIANVKKEMSKPKNGTTATENFYHKFITQCRMRFEDIDSGKEEEEEKLRIPKLTVAAFLFSINTKLSYCRYLKNMHVRGGISVQTAAKIMAEIDNILKTHLKENLNNTDNKK